MAAKSPGFNYRHITYAKRLAKCGGEVQDE